MSDERNQAMLTMFLADQDEPCPMCGYNLRALQGHTCPECGNALRLGVGLQEPRWAAFVVGLAALSGGFVFCALLMSYALWAIAVGEPGPTRGDAFVLACGALVTAVMTACWYHYMTALRTAAPLTRWALAGACLLVPPGVFMVFLLVVR